MKTLSWNVQGIGNTWTLRALKSLVWAHSLDLIFLIVTKLLRGQAKNLADSLNFQNWWAVDRVGMSGGLMLIWKSGVNLKILDGSCGHIAALVAGSGVTPWLFSGLYGTLTHQKDFCLGSC